MQGHRPDPRRALDRARRAGHDRQGQRRRQPRPGDALQRDEHPHAAGLQRRRGAASASSVPRASPNCSRSSTNSSFPPADPRSARRRHPRSAAPARRRRVPPGRRRARRVLRVDASTPCGRSSSTAACTTTATATSRRGWPCVEASWQLGDRPLRLSPRTCAATTSATLQTALGRLGFDCGRVDGIFGPATARALEDFQRNCGLDVDGVCGTATVRALQINGARDRHRPRRGRRSASSSS